MLSFSPLPRPTFWMTRALEEARKAFEKGEVPVGALIIEPSTNRLIASAHNQMESSKNPLAHAEMLVLMEALQQKQKKLTDCDLYVTLEPCPMCAQAISFARIARVFFGAYDLKGGGIDHGPRIFESPACFHRPRVIGGILERKCQRILKDFFNNLR